MSLHPARWHAWLEPVGPASPTGCDARHQREHELLRDEIAKLQSVQGGEPDWAQIEELGSALLLTQSKDLLVASYVACAWSVREGLEGAAEGASFVAALLVRFGTQLHPRRSRAQANSLAWYLAWLASRLERASEPTGESAFSLRAAIAALHIATTTTLGPDTPSFEALLRACERLHQSGEPRADLVASSTSTGVLSPAAAPATSVAAADHQAAPPERSRVARASARDSGPAFSSHSPAPPSAPRLPTSCALQPLTQAAQLGSGLVELARDRFAADRSDARSYRWLRTGVWLRWEQAPTPHRRGKTELEGPSSMQRARLHKAESAESWDELLGLSELSLVKHPLWLDLNRSAALALSHLGTPFARARQHVERESRALLARMPGLAELLFSDGTPLASDQTRQWLARPMTEHAHRSGSSALIPESLAPRLQAGERAALHEFDELLHGCRSQRASFQLRLALGLLLEQGGRTGQAALVYFGLERDIDSHHLERWEPDLTLHVLSRLCQISSVPEAVSPADAARVRAKLAQQSPTALL